MMKIGPDKATNTRGHFSLKSIILFGSVIGLLTSGNFANNAFAAVHTRHHHNRHVRHHRLAHHAVYTSGNAAQLGLTTWYGPGYSGKAPAENINSHVRAALAGGYVAGGLHQFGVASWYGPGFHTHRTASGERYNMFAMTAASRTLPLLSYAKVTNLRTGKQIMVKINDRGPYVGHRIIDLSYAAAKQLGILAKGTAMVQVEGLHRPVSV